MAQAAEQKHSFADALDIVEQLEPDEQQMLIKIVQSRLRERRRQELVARVREAEEEYRAGNYRTGTAEELMAEIDKCDYRVPDGPRPGLR